MSVASPISASALPPLYRWQKAALQDTHEVLGRSDHLYVSAPTASGKSRYMFEAGESLDVPGERVIVVGMKQIVAQHRESFIEFGCTPVEESDECETFLTPRGHLVTITTWQGLNKKDPRHIAILMFDECHIGGSGDDATTIPSIFEKFTPTKRIYISATTQTANENLLGKKAGHLYRYSYAEAYEDGVLHPVDLVEVHTGINAQIVKNIEDDTGKNMSDIEELTSNGLDELSRDLEGKSVAYGRNAAEIAEMLRNVMWQRHKEMIELYLHRHPGEQAIFFSPNIEAAERAKEVFNSRARRKGVGVHAHVCHSRVDDPDAVIRRFRSGEIKVVFVVGMLQEGFNHSDLWLAFDCRFHRDWNGGRIARLVQRLGRVMRRGKSKPKSLYYYARDIRDFYHHKGTSTPEVPLVCEDDPEEAQTQASTAPEIDLQEISEGAPIYAAGVLDCAEREGGDETPDWGREIEVNPTEIEQITVVDDDGISPPAITKIVTATTPLYVIRHLRDHTIVRQYNVGALFGNSAEQNKAALLAWPVGTPRPNSTKETLGQALISYTCKPCSSYDAEFDVAVRARHPDWFRDTVVENKTELLNMPVGSPRPNGKKTILGGALTRYTLKDGRLYDAEFDVAIRARHPDWFRDTAAENKTELLNMPVGSPRPSQSKTIGRALCNYLTCGGGTYDAEFDVAVRARHPDWFRDTAAENKAELLNMPVGSPRPKGKKERLGNVLVYYTCKAMKTYDAEFDVAIRARHPDWFRDTAAENKAELLNMPVGSPKPIYRKHPLGEALLRYVNKNTRSYDAEFDVAVRARHPDWFRDTAAENKAELLIMPVGSPRPACRKHQLGEALSRYTNVNGQSYDAAFDTAIRVRHPDWFRDTAAEKKAELLSMPVGSPRPNNKHAGLGQALTGYTSKNNNSYDAEFDVAVRARHPDWFRDTAAEKKAELLSMPVGSPRPSSSKGPQGTLGRAIVNYMNKSGTTYDPEFDAAIRAKQPHWFRK
jgi:superfamily II DNA or RNA helicase/uncharacterized protein YecE (DUF72 family)